VDLSGDPTFRTVLARTREAAVDAYAHQELPFERLVEELRPGRSAHHNPIFQVVFALEHDAAGAVDLPGLTATELPTSLGTAKFDLLLSMVEGAGRLGGAFSFKTDLFDRGTVDRIAADWVALLDEVLPDPDRPIGPAARPAPEIRRHPEPADPRLAAGAGGRPETAVQELIAAIWCDVLELPEIGLDADFFSLGGYSLLVSRAIAGQEELLGGPLSIRTFFENPTVRSLAAAVERGLTDDDRARLDALAAEIAG
jgi:hypothetical protein